VYQWRSQGRSPTEVEQQLQQIIATINHTYIPKQTHQHRPIHTHSQSQMSLPADISREEAEKARQRGLPPGYALLKPTLPLLVNKTAESSRPVSARPQTARVLRFDFHSKNGVPSQHPTPPIKTPRPPSAPPLRAHTSSHVPVRPQSAHVRVSKLQHVPEPTRSREPLLPRPPSVPPQRRSIRSQTRPNSSRRVRDTKAVVTAEALKAHEIRLAETERTLQCVMEMLQQTLQYSKTSNSSSIQNLQSILTDDGARTQYYGGDDNLPRM